MNNIRSIIRKSCLTVAVALLTLATPLATLSNVSADEACTPPPTSTYGPGIHEPTGSEAKAFVFQCGEGNPFAGKWLSAHYIYHPDRDKYEAREPIVYYYNDTSGEYDFKKWVYDAQLSDYRQVQRSTATPPAGAQKVGSPKPKPAVDAPAQGVSTASNTADTTATANAAAINGIGPNSSATVNTDTDNTATLNNTNNVTVNNNIGSTASSGNALVIGNAVGGNATSGDVVTQANVTNMLQSSSNSLGSGTEVVRFTYTINGDHNGDLLFDPNMVTDVQGDVTINDTLNNNLDINNTSNATINNNINLASTSGDATVANNRQGGNATTGDARSVANIANIIRSSITAGRSFVGTINITGNLNGDILLPADFVDTLIASNVPTVSVSGPNSTNTTTSKVDNTTTVTNTNNQGITNQINSTAQSGNASVRGNRTAGAAKSGNAATNVEAFNLTGSRVVAKNSVLVYVNNLGKWTGIIVNAPAGATAAQLGGNVTQNRTVNNDTNITNTTNQQINNNVNIAATSGDAAVSGNATGGDATTGDAETAVNISNIQDSTFELSDWFGILYINVFGTWCGSFGVDTANCNEPVGGRGGDTSGATKMLVGNVGKLVRYPASTHAPVTASTTRQSTEPATPPTTTTVAAPATEDGVVLASTTKETPKQVAATGPKGQESTSSKLWLPVLGLLAAIAILGSERFFKRQNTI